MTTAHRPTLDPIRGRRDANAGSILHARILPAHTKLKFRQKGQGGDGDGSKDLEEMKRELAIKEKEHDLKRGVEPQAAKKLKLIEQFKDDDRDIFPEKINKDEDENGEDGDDRDSEDGDDDDEDGDSEDGEDEDDDEDDDDEDEDEQEALYEALLQIKEEREIAQRKREEKLQQAREKQIAAGNPLLGSDLQVKRRWDDDAVFKNQAKSSRTVPMGFVNDSLHSEFHQRFMDKYVR